MTPGGDDWEPLSELFPETNRDAGTVPLKLPQRNSSPEVLAVVNQCSTLKIMKRPRLKGGDRAQSTSAKRSLAEPKDAEDAEAEPKDTENTEVKVADAEPEVKVADAEPDAEATKRRRILPPGDAAAPTSTVARHEFNVDDWTPSLLPDPCDEAQELPQEPLDMAVKPQEQPRPLLDVAEPFHLGPVSQARELLDWLAQEMEAEESHKDNESHKNDDLAEEDEPWLEEEDVGNLP